MLARGAVRAASFFWKNEAKHHVILAPQAGESVTH